MNNYKQEFPLCNQVWKGAILYTIAHAISMVADGLLSHEVTWDGINYNRQDSMGTRGTITFSQHRIVGIFRDDHSSRAPWHSKETYDLSHFFKGIPSDLLSLAHENALQYVVDEYEGMQMPIITAAFWSEDTHLTAIESWNLVFSHGAHLVRIEVMETELAIRELRNEYELSTSQESLLISLFNEKISRPNTAVSLTHEQQAVLLASGDAGLQDSRELLASINIII